MEGQRYRVRKREDLGHKWVIHRSRGEETRQRGQSKRERVGNSGFTWQIHEQVKKLAKNRNSLMIGMISVVHEVVNIRHCLEGERKAIDAHLVSVVSSIARGHG